MTCLVTTLSGAVLHCQRRPGIGAALLARLMQARGCSSSKQQASEAPCPSEIRLHKAEKVLEVCYPDGRRARFSAELLRVLSPSADTQRLDAKGHVRVVSGRRHVGILGVEPVGSYAIRIQFDDLHAAGIYSWQYLHELGAHRFSRAKAYLRALRAAGGSRDPPVSGAVAAALAQRSSGAVRGAVAGSKTPENTGMGKGH